MYHVSLILVQVVKTKMEHGHLYPVFHNKLFVTHFSFLSLYDAASMYSWNSYLLVQTQLFWQFVLLSETFIWWNANKQDMRIDKPE